MALGEFRFKKLWVIFCLVGIPGALLAHPHGTANAKEIEGVTFPEQLDLGAQKLTLNGVGLRKVRKMGVMTFKVYVAGLYLMTKKDNSTEILASPEPKVLRLVFKREVDAATLRKAWTESYAKNCKLECEKTKANLKMFNDFMVDVHDKESLQLRFDEDGVNIVFSGGKEPHSGHIASEAFRKNLLSVFIGDAPPTEELKAGLLGKDAGG